MDDASFHAAVVAMAMVELLLVEQLAYGGSK